jgi:hypothetical protein
MSAKLGDHQYFRKPPDIDLEVEHLVQFVLKEASTDQQTRACSDSAQSKDSTAQVHIITHVDRRVEPVIQNGPMCGLVALTMAYTMLGGCCTGASDDKAHPEILLQVAKERETSKNGEIFAVENLEGIARDHLQCQAEVVELALVDVLDVILQGKTLLVPYDADKDHAPCLEKGHKAHWCLLVGFAIVLSPNFDNLFNLQQCCMPSLSLPGHFVVREDEKASLLANKLSLQSSAQLYVFARHGKSTHLGLWKFTSLLESNGNLVEMDPRRTRPGEYVIPDGGIERGLSGKALVVSHPVGQSWT